MEFHIRDEVQEDIDEVREILRAAFPTAAESKLVDMLRENDKAVVSLVAVNADEVLGHVLFTPVSTTPPGDTQGVGLAPVAVRRDVQSYGIGLQLIHHGLDLCKALGFDYCVVIGDPKYYRRFGFEQASKLGIQNEYGVVDEFMVVRFSNRALTGMVKYEPE